MTFVRAGQRAVVYVSLGLLAAALVTELRKPAAERTWHGYVAGVVPYDFRLSQASRLQASAGNTDTDRLLVPRTFGVGWNVNFAELARRLRKVELPGRNRR